MLIEINTKEVMKGVAYHLSVCLSIWLSVKGIKIIAIFMMLPN